MEFPNSVLDFAREKQSLEMFDNNTYRSEPKGIMTCTVQGLFFPSSLIKPLAKVIFK